MTLNYKGQHTLEDWHMLPFSSSSTYIIWVDVKVLFLKKISLVK